MPVPLPSSPSDASLATDARTAPPESPDLPSPSDTATAIPSPTDHGKHPALLHEDNGASAPPHAYPQVHVPAHAHAHARARTRAQEQEREQEQEHERESRWFEPYPHDIERQADEEVALERIRSGESTTSGGSRRPRSHLDRMPSIAARVKSELQSHKERYTDTDPDHEPGKEDVENQCVHEEQEQETEQDDPDLVTFDSPDSPENPRNWAYGRKLFCACTVAVYSFLSPFSSAVIAPAIDQIAHDLNITNEAESIMVMSIFVLAYAFGTSGSCPSPHCLGCLASCAGGAATRLADPDWLYATGPFFWSPMSEIYGRRPVLVCGNLMFLAFNLGSSFAHKGTGVSGKVQIFVLRFLAGFGGSAPLVLGGATVADLFVPAERGTAMSIYTAAPVVAPALGPLIGSWVADRLTSTYRWRVTLWATSGFAALVASVGFFILPETYQPRILQVKCDRLKHQTGNARLHTPFNQVEMTTGERIRTAMVRPYLMLATEPILIALAVAMLILYGCLYIALASYEKIFKDIYHQSTGIAGLNYIAIFLGCSIGGQIGGRSVDIFYRKLTARNGGVRQPEYKLPAFMIGVVLFPIGLIMYGFSAQWHVFWLVPDIGAAIFAFGNFICMLALQTCTSPRPHSKPCALCILCPAFRWQLAQTAQPAGLGCTDFL